MVPSSSRNGGALPTPWGVAWCLVLLALVGTPVAARQGGPALVIEAVRSYDLELDPAATIRLPPDRRALEIHYGVQGADPSARYTYALRLEGADRRWEDVGERTTVRYRHLRPGAYTFRVRASGPAGQLGPANLSVVVEGRWFEALWVRGLLALLVVGLVLAGHRARTVRLRRRAAALVEVVERRTAELSREKERAEAALAEAEREREASREALVTVEEQAIQLLRIDHLKSRLFANLSHEFRTPLTLILDPLDRVIREGALAEPERQALRQAHTNALRILHLINQVLDLAKIDAGAMDLRARARDLIPFVRQTTEVFHSEAERRGVDLRFHSALPAAEVYFDPPKLEKVVFNLLSNALKATAPGGKVLVSVHEEPGGEGPGSVGIAVQDTGVGIPEAEVESIFDRFFQAKAGERWGGTGIGLALVKELVELHRGEIRVESVVGFGTTFTVCLPLGREHLHPGEVEEEEAAPSASEEAAAALADVADPPFPAEPAQVDGQTDGQAQVDGQAQPAPERDPRPLVLVVEDNAEIRGLICSHLRPHYATAEAGDGAEGLRRALELRPDLVLTDLAMPEVDGLELCRRMRADPDVADTPILLLTAHASNERRLEGLQTGADDFLTKPFSGEELLVRVRNLIRSREALQARYRQEVVVRPLGKAVHSSEAAFLARVYDAVAEHLADEAFSVPALAEAVGVSESQLKRRLRQMGEPSPVEFIRARRLERGAELLAAHFGTVAEVAMEVGFGSASYFARCFRERYGVAPSEYAAHLAAVGGEEERGAPGGDGR